MKQKLIIMMLVITAMAMMFPQALAQGSTNADGPKISAKAIQTSEVKVSERAQYNLKLKELNTDKLSFEESKKEFIKKKCKSKETDDCEKAKEGIRNHLILWISTITHKLNSAEATLNKAVTKKKANSESAQETLGKIKAVKEELNNNLMKLERETLTNNQLVMVSQDLSKIVSDVKGIYLKTQKIERDERIAEFVSRLDIVVTRLQKVSKDMKAEGKTSPNAEEKIKELKGRIESIQQLVNEEKQQEAVSELKSIPDDIKGAMSELNKDLGREAVVASLSGK